MPAPSLRRSLVIRMLFVSLLPLLILGIGCTQLAERIIFERFEADSLARAQAVATRLYDRVLVVTRNARLVAEIQPTHDVLTLSDAAAVRRLLIPLKTRLGLDQLNLGDTRGRIVAGAQDIADDRVIPDELSGPFARRAEQSWMLDQQAAGGLLLLAAAPVRIDGRIAGIVQTGAFLDADFLRPLAQSGDGGDSPTDALIGLFWNGRAQAVTSEPLSSLAVPTKDELWGAQGNRLVRQVVVAGAPYYAVFSLVESHQATPAVLAVLLPLAQVEAARQAMLAILAVLLIGLAAGVVFFAYRSAATFTAPVLRLAAAAQRLERGDLHVAIATTAPHELGVLERGFATMAESLQAREQALAGLVGQLELRATSDELTGLPNRAALQARLEKALSSSDASTPIALLLIDLDRFKEVNDTLGHQAGDAVLLQVARRFRETVSTSDTVARLGGDEFAVLLPATSMVGAVHVARKLLTALETPVHFLDRPLDVGASIGISTRLDDNDDAAALLRRSDVAMYTAKRGRSGYACYAPDQDDHSTERLARLGELRQAIASNQLVLHFQPKVSLATGRVVHTEALVRWQHPEHGLLPPDRFIPLAEQTGLIAPLTEWVLRAALQQARAWHHQGREIPVAVNVSVQNLHEPRFAIRVAEMLHTYGVLAKDLIVEITETSVLLDPARASDVLRQLRALGVRVAIDDFGAGQSSLGYLKHLPADELKIDRSFIHDLQHGDRDAAIVRATIELGHSLGLSVVAEGVEDEDTCAQLAALGCDIAQGFFIARPLAPDALESWLGTSPWAENASPLERAA